MARRRGVTAPSPSHLLYFLRRQADPPQQLTETGIGVDRLTVLLTDSRSIRDVILFPLLRPEKAEE